MEVAFVSSDKLRYALDKKNTNPIDYIQKVFFSHPRKFLSTLTIGNLLVLIVFVYSSIVLSQDYIFKNITMELLMRHWKNTEEIMDTEQYSISNK